MHFFRRSEIHLDCFTYRREVIEYAPVVTGAKAIPDWWKKLPKQVKPTAVSFYPIPTMKTCVGMYDYYNKSVAMPLWSDLAVAVADEGVYSWQFSDNTTSASAHPKEQYAGFSGVDFHGHLKLESPWLFVTKQDVNWILTDPIYSRKNFKDYVLAQGLLNFSKQNGTNLQLFIDTTIPREYVIPFGTTFLFTPMTDKKVVLHRHLVREESYRSRKAKTCPITFINKYRNQLSIPKCPYKDDIK